MAGDPPKRQNSDVFGNIQDWMDTNSPFRTTESTKAFPKTSA